jgi:hypothetical protein
MIFYFFIIILILFIRAGSIGPAIPRPVLYAKRRRKKKRQKARKSMIPIAREN